MIGAQRYHGTDGSDTSRVYGGREFGYNYGPTGNRTNASETIGGKTLVKNYVANEKTKGQTLAPPSRDILFSGSERLPTYVVTQRGVVQFASDGKMSEETYQLPPEKKKEEDEK